MATRKWLGKFEGLINKEWCWPPQDFKGLINKARLPVRLKLLTKHGTGHHSSQQLSWPFQ